MPFKYNVVKGTFDCTCDVCNDNAIYWYSEEAIKNGWGIKLDSDGYATFILCPDCKVGYDLELIHEKYGDREDLSYDEIAAAQEEWYIDD